MAQEDCTPLWDKYPTDLDGWVLAHAAIREDEKIIADLVAALLSQCERGIALRSQQRSALLEFWRHLNTTIHKHHEAEDLIVSPYMETVKKIEVPPIMASEHVHILEALEKCDVLVKKNKNGCDAFSDAATLRQLAAELKDLTEYCDAHFEMEEKEVLPLLRASSTPAEVSAHITKPIVGKMNQTDVGGFYKKLDPEKFKAFTKQEKIPWFGVLAIKYAIWRYTVNIIYPIEIAKDRATAACAKRRGSSSRHS